MMRTTFGARLMMLAMIVQLLGAVRTVKFMALAGNAGEGNGGDQQGKEFHRRAI